MRQACVQHDKVWVCLPGTVSQGGHVPVDRVRKCVVAMAHKVRSFLKIGPLGERSILLTLVP